MPLLLREVIAFDWKFPAEQNELDDQFRLPQKPLTGAIRSPDAALLQAEAHARIAELDWVNAPARFSEQLSAHLWATHQIEAFREASVAYVHQINLAAAPEKLPHPG